MIATLEKKAKENHRNSDPSLQSRLLNNGYCVARSSKITLPFKTLFPKRRMHISVVMGCRGVAAASIFVANGRPSSNSSELVSRHRNMWLTPKAGILSVLVAHVDEWGHAS